MVVAEFNNDNCTLNLHVANPWFNKLSLNNVKIRIKCYLAIRNSNIRLKYKTNFLKNEELLTFLQQNDLNVFIYDDYENYNGISSVIDYALSVDTPFAISNSNMFKHLVDMQPSPFLTPDRSLRDIMNAGIQGIKEKRIEYSSTACIDKMERIINNV